MKKLVSISTGAIQLKYGDLRAIELAKEIGVDAIDFNTDGRRFDVANPDSIYSKGDEEIVAFFSEIRRRADELGILIGQTHGRIRGFQGIPEEDNRLIQNARCDFLAAEALGAEAVVVHGVHINPNSDPKLLHDMNFDMFTRMLEYAKMYHVKVATETFGDAPSYGCCDFFGKISNFLMSYNRVCAVNGNGEHFTVCVDTGHSNKAARFEQPSPADVIRMIGKNVTVLHLNDNDGLTDQHKIPMTGSIDWNDIFDALDEIGYEGIYNMELKLTDFGKDFILEEAAFAVKVMREFLRTRYGSDC